MKPVKVFSCKFMCLSLVFSAFYSSFAAAEPRLAKLVPVTEVSAGIDRVFFGRVAAKETVDLAFQVSGQIVELPIVEGGPVTMDGVVAQLDLEPFELALDEARAQLDQAQRNSDRMEQLSGTTVSQATVDDAQTTLDIAHIAVRNAERSLEQATLHAPFDGLVAARLVANFSTIGAGTPVARLHDMSDIRIEIDVPEVLFQRAGRDPDIQVLAEFPSSDTLHELEFREFNAETAQVGQTFSITFGMVPPEDLVILPGSSVKVTARSRAAASRVIVPSSALLLENDGSASVMLFEPAGADTGSVRKVAIDVEPTEFGAVEVTSGLDAGQEVVVSGAHLLADGDEVKRFMGFSN